MPGARKHRPDTERKTIHWRRFRAADPARGREAGIERLTCTLRCCEVVYYRPMGGAVSSRTSANVPTARLDQVYADTRTMSRPGGFDLRPGQSIRIAFDVPEGEYETRLSERPPRFWELEVAADTPGIDCRARFLVPVYA